MNGGKARQAMLFGVSHTLDRKRYSPDESGQLVTASVKNLSKSALRFHKIGVKFEWQRDTGMWYTKKCSVTLKPGETAELPVVRFAIPVDVALGVRTYRVGVLAQRLVPGEEGRAAAWKDFGQMWAAGDNKIRIVAHADRDYQVFVSHSNHADDKQLVECLASMLQSNGIRPFVAEEFRRYGENLWTKIRKGIIKADWMIVLWTKHGAKSPDVREELGIAVGSRKRFVPVIEHGAKAKGSLIGAEYVRLVKEKHREVFAKLTSELIGYAVEKEGRVGRARSEKEPRDGGGAGGE